MKNVPERAGIPEIRKLDVAFCECGGPLDFFLQPGFTSPTGIGQIIESCARCKRSNVMRPVAPRSVSEYVGLRKPVKLVPAAGPPCEVCKTPTVWKGTGRRARWCIDCRPIEEQKIRDALNAKRKQYDRERVPRRKHRAAA